MKIRQETLIKRANLIAEREGKEITEENVQAYIMAAIAEETKMIEDLMYTTRGQQAFNELATNMATRMYNEVNKEESQCL